MKYKRRQLFVPVVFAICMMSGTVNSEPVRHDYDYVVNNFFWGELYSQGGWSFYCGYQFDQNRKTEQGRVIDVGHIYPIDWILEDVDCSSRLQCFDNGDERFMEMEADLHNMYPVWHELVLLRNNLPFGEVSEENRRFSDCDFKRSLNAVEPREIARGNVARAIFYMHDRYGLVIEPGMLDILRKWNRRDPPSKQERYRNDRIEAFQGRRNRYIDNPSLAEEIHANKQQD